MMRNIRRSVWALLALPALALGSEYSVSFFQGLFIVRKGDQTTQIPLVQPETQPPLYISYRRDDAWVVWDDRGLTLRRGKKVFSTKLKEIATSPKLQTPEQLKKTVELIEKGTRKVEATALSGSRRIGTDVYFLLRWDDSEGTPWLEALVKVDLTAEKLIPQLVGKFDGLSLSNADIDDKLILHKDALGVITRNGEDWGEALFTPGAKVFSYRKLGRGLQSFRMSGNLAGQFVDTSTYGASLAGLVDLSEGRREESLETRGSIELLGGNIAVIKQKSHRVLRNLATGAETNLDPSAQFRLIPEGVLAYWGGMKPKKAVLYRTSDWSVLGAWN